MTLTMVLIGGWVLLSVVCFSMGTGMFRRERSAALPGGRVRRAPEARIPAPRMPTSLREHAGV